MYHALLYNHLKLLVWNHLNYEFDILWEKNLHWHIHNDQMNPQQNDFTEEILSTFLMLFSYSVKKVVECRRVNLGHVILISVSENHQTLFCFRVYYLQKFDWYQCKHTVCIWIKIIGTHKAASNKLCFYL